MSNRRTERAEHLEPRRVGSSHRRFAFWLLLALVPFVVAACLDLGVTNPDGDDNDDDSDTPDDTTFHSPAHGADTGTLYAVQLRFSTTPPSA